MESTVDIILLLVPMVMPQTTVTNQSSALGLIYPVGSSLYLIFFPQQLFQSHSLFI